MKIVLEEGPKTSTTEKKLLHPDTPKANHLNNEITIFNLASALFECQITSTANFIYELMLHNWIALKNYSLLLPLEGRHKALKVLTKFNSWSLDLIRCVLKKSLSRYFEKGFDLQHPLTIKTGANKMLTHDAQKKISPVILEVATFLDYNPAHLSLLLPLRWTIFFNTFDVTVRDYTSVATGEATVFDQKDDSFTVQGDATAKSLEMVKVYQWRKNATTDENLKAFQSYPKAGIHCSFCGVSQNVIGMVPLKDIPDDARHHPYFARFYIDFKKRLDFDCFNL